MNYVPALRWKLAEKDALRQLNMSTAQHIRPLIEFVMRSPASTDRKTGEKKTPARMLDESRAMHRASLEKMPEEIRKYWDSHDFYFSVDFLDFTLKTDTVERVLSSFEGAPEAPVLVISDALSDDEIASYVSISRKYQGRLAMRIEVGMAMERAEIEGKMKRLLAKMGTVSDDVHLILDAGFVGDTFDGGTILDNTPDLQKWANVVLLAGSFPVDLSGFELGKKNIPRFEMKNWLESPWEKDGVVVSFGDYTIQHAHYREPAPGANPSASVRYATKDEWLILRGQGLRNPKGAGHKQYPAQAMLLIQQDEFHGADHCSGDGYISEIANGGENGKTGSPQTWLRAGINHHIEVTVETIVDASSQ